MWDEDHWSIRTDAAVLLAAIGAAKAGTLSDSSETRSVLYPRSAGHGLLLRRLRLLEAQRAVLRYARFMRNHVHDHDPAVLV